MLCYCNPIFMQNMYHMYDSQSSNELTQLLINHKQYLNVSCLIIYKITYLS